MDRYIKVTLKRSIIGRTKKVRATVKSLGLKRRGRSRVLKDSPGLRGAVKKIPHLLELEEI
ncbi:MAG: 50S ribosomal protein L30 [Thermodesulfobacteriota bacterium]|nr:50S ribosomal protein L30 [Thermodesulfobacteriota bacterium]